MKQLFGIALLSLSVVACGSDQKEPEEPQGPMERAGEEVDEAAEEVADEAEEVVDDAEDAFDDEEETSDEDTE